MSLRIMVVAEDPTYDQYILVPLVRAIAADLGHRDAAVQVLHDPHLRGFSDAVRAMPRVIARYPLEQVFLAMLDRDGDAGRDDSMRHIESELSTPRQAVVGCVAWQEVEAWLLAARWALCRRAFGWTWDEVRAEVNVKEAYFSRFLERFGNPQVPGGGRTTLMAGLNLSAVRDKCPELDDLCARLRRVLDDLRA